MRMRSRAGTLVASKRSAGKRFHRIPRRSAFGFTDATSNAGTADVCVYVTVLPHNPTHTQRRRLLRDITAAVLTPGPGPSYLTLALCRLPFDLTRERP